MNNQTSVSFAFVDLSSCIISYPSISFSFNLSIPPFVSGLILFCFHHIPLFLSSLLLSFVFFLFSLLVYYHCNCNQAVTDHCHFWSRMSVYISMGSGTWITFRSDQLPLAVSVSTHKHLLLLSNVHRWWVDDIHYTSVDIHLSVWLRDQYHTIHTVYKLLEVQFFIPLL